MISHNVALISGIVAAQRWPGLGILGPTLGVLGGAVLQVLILAPGLRGRGAHFRLVWNLADVRLREVIALLIPNGLSVGVNYAGFIVDTAFATRAQKARRWLRSTMPFCWSGCPLRSWARPWVRPPFHA